MLYAEVQGLVNDLVRDTDQVISSGTRDAAIANALERYSQDSPRQLVRDVTSDGSTTLPLPSGWLDGVSDLLTIEYPIGNFPISTLEADSFGVIAAPDGDEIRLAVAAPSSGTDLRLTFTAAHELDDTHNTVPTYHQRALCCLAAADLCGMLASKYASEGTPSIQADAVDHKGKTDRFRKRQGDLLAEYNAIVGTAPSERTKPAGAVAVPTKTTDSLGRPRLFHPTRNWRSTP